jgi:hypothetical protein
MSPPSCFAMCLAITSFHRCGPPMLPPPLTPSHG